MEQGHTALSADLRSLIRIWRGERHLNQIEAARAARISTRYWRVIERGYRTSLPTRTVARACIALAIPPEQLSDIGHSEVAEQMHKITQATGRGHHDDDSKPADGQIMALLSADPGLIEPFIAEVTAQVNRARVRYGQNGTLSGQDIFADPDEARQWEMDDVFPEAGQRIQLIAYIRMLRDESSKNNGDAGSAAG